jgi:GntR family transcriptional regulator
MSDLGFYDRFQQEGVRGLPKYARLREMMVEAIRSGFWKVGEKLPTEQELTRATPFSLGTVQRALRDLAEEGLLVRRQGLGSFVAGTSKRMEDPWHCRFRDDSGRGFLPVFSTTLDRRPVFGTGPWSRHLPYRREGVLRIDRRISIADEFAVYSRFYADPELLRPLAEAPLETLDGANFKRLIAQECRLPITRITHDVRVAAFDREVAAVVGVALGSAGLAVEAVARAGRDTCLYYQELFVPPTTRSLHLAELTAERPE